MKLIAAILVLEHWTVLLSSQYCKAHLRAGLPTRGAGNSDIVGQRTASKHATIPAQVLQPLHLQLPFICGQLHEQALLRPILGMEHDKFNCTCALEGEMGRWHVGITIILSFHRCTVCWPFDCRMAIPNWSCIILISSNWMVSFRNILCKKSDSMLDLLLNSFVFILMAGYNN